MGVRAWLLGPLVGGGVVKPYWSDGQVSLYHGDFREVTAWLDAKVLVTDPPYGVHHSPRGTRGSNSPVIAGEIRTGRAADRELGPGHVALRDEALDMWGARPAVVFGSWRAPRPAKTQALLIWDTMTIGLGGVGPWRPSHQEIYLRYWPNPRRAAREARGTVLRYPALRGAARHGHPSPKPLPLMGELIGTCPAGMIADPFAGVGATLIAARDLGVPAVGVELREDYCETAARRLSLPQLDREAS